MAEDLNFTWSVEEVWGSGQAVDPLSDFFHDLFDNVDLLDIAPMLLSSTWSNGHCGGASIAKRLDRFFMFESSCADFSWYRS